MPKTIVVTSASSGIGGATAMALARAGHTVYAGIQDVHGHHAAAPGRLAALAAEAGVALRTIEIDLMFQASVEAAIGRIIAETGRIDVLVHNSAYRLSGPATAFTPEQLARLYELNVLTTQWVNRAVLSPMRREGAGLIVWVSGISAAGTTPPYLAPYFAMANMESVARLYADALGRWGIDCCSVLPRAFSRRATTSEYEEVDAASVANVIAEIVDTPQGQRPSRVYVHPAQPGAAGMPAAHDGPGHRTQVRAVAAPRSNPAISLAAYQRRKRTA
jgi:NAD(P)-dependent dehydrogenase (short-subunit alcohol dehydrogenase family)